MTQFSLEQIDSSYVTLNGYVTLDRYNRLRNSNKPTDGKPSAMGFKIAQNDGTGNYIPFAEIHFPADESKIFNSAIVNTIYTFQTALKYIAASRNTSTPPPAEITPGNG